MRAHVQAQGRIGRAWAFGSVDGGGGYVRGSLKQACASVV